MTCVHPSRSGHAVVGEPTYERCVAVGRQRYRAALSRVSNSAQSSQLTALLRPNTAAAGVHPCRSRAGVVIDAADNGGATVRGERDRTPLASVSYCASPDQLAALLGPNPVASSKDPGCTRARVISSTTDNRGVAV